MLSMVQKRRASRRGAGLGNRDFDYSQQRPLRWKRSLSHRVKKTLKRLSLKMAKIYNNFGMLNTRAAKQYVAEHNRFIKNAKIDPKEVGKWYAMFDHHSRSIMPAQIPPRSDSMNLERDEGIYQKVLEEPLRQWQ